MLELYILFICISVLLFVIYYYDIFNDNKVESFENPKYYLSACPSGFKMNYNSDGDTLCYIEQNLNIPVHLLKYQKNGGQCILNGRGTRDIPNCVDYILNYYRKQSIQFCNPSLPSYFEDNSKKTKGCTRGELNELLNGPRMESQPTCIIYPNEEDNQFNINSCMNQKELEEYPCFGSNCTKQLVQYGRRTPLLLMINFADTNGFPRTAYSRKSIIRFLDAVWSGWRQRLNIDRTIFNADIAKKYFIDKTLSPADVDI
jgi:hypothetical protein